MTRLFAALIASLSFGTCAQAQSLQLSEQQLYDLANGVTLDQAGFVALLETTLGKPVDAEPVKLGILGRVVAPTEMWVIETPLAEPGNDKAAALCTWMSGDVARQLAEPLSGPTQDFVDPLRQLDLAETLVAAQPLDTASAVLTCEIGGRQAEPLFDAATVTRFSDVFATRADENPFFAQAREGESVDLAAFSAGPTISGVRLAQLTVVTVRQTDQIAGQAFGFVAVLTKPSS